MCRRPPGASRPFRRAVRRRSTRRRQKPEGVRHLTVACVDPARILRLTGGLGPLQSEGVAGSLTLTEKEGKTAVELAYHVGGYVPAGQDKYALPVDSVLLEQITRLRRYVETGDAKLE